MTYFLTFDGSPTWRTVSSTRTRPVRRPPSSIRLQRHPDPTSAGSWRRRSRSTCFAATTGPAFLTLRRVPRGAARRPPRAHQPHGDRVQFASRRSAHVVLAARCGHPSPSASGCWRARRPLPPWAWQRVVLARRCCPLHSTRYGDAACRKVPRHRRAEQLRGAADGHGRAPLSRPLGQDGRRRRRNRLGSRLNFDRVEPLLRRSFGLRIALACPPSSAGCSRYPACAAPTLRSAAAAASANGFGPRRRGARRRRRPLPTSATCSGPASRRTSGAAVLSDVAVPVQRRGAERVASASTCRRLRSAPEGRSSSSGRSSAC